MSRGRYTPGQLYAMALTFIQADLRGDHRAQQLILKLSIRLRLSPAQVRSEIASLAVQGG